MVVLQESRKQIEGALRKKLPFDDDILEYLFKVTPLSEPQELLELVNDFCPRWQADEQARLASQLLAQANSEAVQESHGGGSKSSNEVAVAPSPAMESASTMMYDPAADELLARMLQEEEEAEAAFHQGRITNEGRGGKKGKKSFKPLAIDYRVGQNATPAQLGTAAPSSLADLLRNRRAQEQNAGNVLRPGEQFGPAAQRQPAPAGSSPFAPPQPLGGLSWAERAAFAAEQAEQEKEAAEEVYSQPTPVRSVAASGQGRPPGSQMHLKLRSGTGQEYQVSADSNETFGDVKARVEKLYSIAASGQRIFHMGRELSDRDELRSSGITPGQTLSLALRDGASAPTPTAAARAPASRPRAAEVMSLRLQLPGGSQPKELRSVPVSTSIQEVKRRIEKDHGIRHDHLGLSFFGRVLQDHESLGGIGAASGALIDVAIAPPGSFGGPRPGEASPSQGKKNRPPRQADLSGLQTSDAGRVLSEEEALEMALAASQQPEMNGRVGALPVDEDAEGDEQVDSYADFLVDVSLQDDKLQGLIGAARCIVSSNGLEDFISRVSKRSGYKLTLLAEKGKKAKQVFGIIVYRFGQKVINVIQLVVANEHRAQGVGDHMVKWLISYGAKSKTPIALSCFPESTSFYKRHGFTVLAANNHSYGELESVEGQVYLEHLCRKTGGAKTGTSSPAGGKQGKPSRADLIQKMFGLCDVDRDGRLTRKEMQEFAKLTGFDGSDEDWNNEYQTLCSENGCNAAAGVDMSAFSKLIDDESDSGCYCTEAELEDMIKKLQASGRSIPAPSPPRPAPTAAAKAAPPSSTTGFSADRDELIHALFSCCDRDRDEILNMVEMRRFATLTGFDGSEADWNQEFIALTSSYTGSPADVNLTLFKQLVDDQSDDGCYCTDAEMQDFLKQVRTELVKDLFAYLDTNGDGKLDKGEMKVFAAHTGFDGDDAAWAEEYRMLCSSYSGVQSSITKELFQKLVDDESDDGCYCTNIELRDMLSAPTARLTQNPTPAPPPQTKPVQQPAVAPAARSTDSRQELIRKTFTSFDDDNDGCLNSEEMRRFAGMTGFEGHDQEWASEFRMLCGTYNGVHSSISLSLFERLVNDQSDDGCYCSDDELKDMLLQNEARAPPQRPAPPTSKPPAPPPHMTNVPLSSDRDNLIKKAFHGFDSDGDGVLNQSEMRLFATETGFDGSDADWAGEFKMLCSIGDCPTSCSLELFTKLVNDESEDGCYCTDEELRDMLPAARGVATPQQAATRNVDTGGSQAQVQSSAAQAGKPESARSQLIRDVFHAFDADKDGTLNQHEMRRFAEATGFEGTDADWASEYRMLCSSYNGVQSSISLALFAKLVDDETDDGCYCEDSELQDMLKSQPAKTEVTPKVAPAPVDRTPAPPPVPVVKDDPRTVLTKDVFKALDKDQDGFLNSCEMRRFAEATGFEGDDTVWKEEYELLCSTYGGMKSAIDVALFLKLVNDETDDGCYCTDDELKDMLAKVSQASAGKDKAAAPQSRAAAEKAVPSLSTPAVRAVASNAVPDAASAKMTRADLINVVFRACDDDGDGFLNQQEMQQFAILIGFEGSDDEWAADFVKLCSENGCTVRKGIDGETFLKLVEDRGDNGCFCTTKELKKMVQVHFFDKVKARVNNGNSGSQASSSRRTERMKILFKSLDTDADDLLSEDEMFYFASSMGFSGTGEEWAYEFRELLNGPHCKGAGKGSKGIDFRSFAKLVNDESDSGSYCTDEEIEELLKRFQRDTPAATSTVSRAPPGLEDWEWCDEGSGFQVESSSAGNSKPSGSGGRAAKNKDPAGHDKGQNEDDEWASWETWKQTSANAKASSSGAEKNGRQKGRGKQAASWNEGSWNDDGDWWASNDAQSQNQDTWWASSGQDWHNNDDWSNWQGNGATNQGGRGRGGSSGGKAKGKGRNKR